MRVGFGFLLSVLQPLAILLAVLQPSAAIAVMVAVAGENIYFQFIDVT